MPSSIRILIVSLVFSFMGSAQASTMLTGNTVSFEFDSALTGLFGMPTVSGDTLFFTPSNFKAMALNSDGMDIASNTFNVKVQSLNPLQNINTVAVTQKGDYMSYGDSTMVNVGGQVRAFAISDPLIDVTQSIAASGSFVETGFLETPNWQADTVVDTSAFGSSYINVTIESLLGAVSSVLGQGAFVENKFIGLNVTAVPLPSAFWLMGAALMGLISSANRRKLA